MCPTPIQIRRLLTRPFTRSLEIASKHSLGFAAYLDPSLWHADEDGNTTTDKMSDTVDLGRYTVERVLAAHVVNGQKYLLICWEGHTVPTWAKDDGDLIHELTCESILDLQDDTEEFQKHIGPEAYGMSSGRLNSRYCCAGCAQEGRDGFDYRVYIDASVKGNVCLCHSPLACTDLLASLPVTL